MTIEKLTVSELTQEQHEDDVEVVLFEAYEADRAALVEQAMHYKREADRLTEALSSADLENARQQKMLEVCSAVHSHNVALNAQVRELAEALAAAELRIKRNMACWLEGGRRLDDAEARVRELEAELKLAWDDQEETDRANRAEDRVRELKSALDEQRRRADHHQGCAEVLRGRLADVTALLREWRAARGTRNHTAMDARTDDFLANQASAPHPMAGTELNQYDEPDHGEADPEYPAHREHFGQPAAPAWTVSTDEYDRTTWNQPAAPTNDQRPECYGFDPAPGFDAEHSAQIRERMGQPAAPSRFQGWPPFDQPAAPTRTEAEQAVLDTVAQLPENWLRHQRVHGSVWDSNLAVAEFARRGVK